MKLGPIITIWWWWQFILREKLMADHFSLFSFSFFRPIIFAFFLFFFFLFSFFSDRSWQATPSGSSSSRRWGRAGSEGASPDYDDHVDDDGGDHDGVHQKSHKHFIPYMGFCASIWDSVRHHCHHHHGNIDVINYQSCCVGTTLYGKEILQRFPLSTNISVKNMLRPAVIFNMSDRTGSFHTDKVGGVGPLCHGMGLIFFTRSPPKMPWYIWFLYFDTMLPQILPYS